MLKRKFLHEDLQLGIWRCAVEMLLFRPPNTCQMPETSCENAKDNLDSNHDHVTIAQIRRGVS